MTKNVHFIGDSHILPIFNALVFFGLDRERLEPEVEYPSEEFQSAYDSAKDIRYIFHSKPGRLAYSPDYENLTFSSHIKSGDTIIFCLGECDIRRHLHRYNNSQYTASRYVEKTREYFKHEDILFLTPILPISGTFYEWISDDLKYSSSEPARVDAHNEFVKTLYQSCSDLSLPDPIDISFGDQTLDKSFRDSDLIHITPIHAEKIAKKILDDIEAHWSQD